MGVSYYLFCDETGHGVTIGQATMGVNSDTSEPREVITLFSLAHREMPLEIVAEPDLTANWESDVAIALFEEQTGEQCPEPWQTLLNKTCGKNNV